MNLMSKLLAIFIVMTACAEKNEYTAVPRTRAVATESATADATSMPQPTVPEVTVPTNPNPPIEPAKTTPVVTAPIRNSNGTGGGTGLIEVPYTDSNGLASSYKINVPADASQKIYGLHIHLHGDGGGGYTDFPNKETRNDLIGVTIKAPNTNLQWGRAQGKAHAFYVNDLIQKELTKKYNVNLDKIYFSSVSGGSYFMTGSFIPEFGQNYNSGVFAMCGGEAPRVAFTDPKVLSKFRIHWEVTAGERQDIQTSVQSSMAAYKTASTNAAIPVDQQAKIQTSTIQGAGGHCVFDGVSYTSGIQQAIDAKFKMILP